MLLKVSGRCVHAHCLHVVNAEACGHSNLQLKKDKKTKEHLKIGQKFLYEELIEHQIKLIELEERVESRYAEFCAGEEMKTQEEPWPSTAVKAGKILFVLILAVNIGGTAVCCVCDACAVTLFELGAGGAGKNPTEAGRMVGKSTSRSGDAIMIDFYRPGSLLKNGVVVSADRAKNSSSYPVLVAQEKAMRLLD
jgi:hypothetical protein